MFIFEYAIWISGGGRGLLSVNACDQPANRGFDAQNAAAILGMFFTLFCIAGIFSVCMLVSTICLFRVHADRNNAYTKFLSSNAYAMYILHPVAVIPLTGLFIVVARALTHQNAFSHPAEDALNADVDAVNFADCVSAGGPTDQSLVLCIGWAVVCTLSVLLTTIFSMAVRALPGMKAVL